MSVLHRIEHLVDKSKGVVILRPDLITTIRNGLLLDWERIRSVTTVLIGDV